MNVNCPRDPLTCRCEYHSGYVPPMALESVPDGRDEPAPFVTYFRLDSRGIEDLPLVPWAQRPPIAPGVLIDDEPVLPSSRWRLVARWGGGLAMVVAAASIMYAEGQRQPAPGVGFGIALSLLMGAALLLPLGRSNDG